jgi:hypothetical protein
MIAMYGREIFPLLVESGFRGTVATSEKKLVRGRCWAHASGKDGALVVQIQGYFSPGSGIRTRIAEKLDVPPAERGRAIADLRARVRRVLRAIDDEQRAAPLVPAKSLAEALKALFDRKGSALRVAVTRVERRGRTFALYARGRRKAVIADRTMLLTLVRALAGGRVFERGRNPRYLLHDIELVAYIEKLAEVDVDEARALYIHFYSAYQTHLASDETRPLAKLFPKPVWAAKHLNVGSTATSLIRRALPHAAKGSLVDRVAAPSTIDVALSSVHDSDPRFAETMAALRDLTTSMANATFPIFREIAWLLEREMPPS